MSLPSYEKLSLAYVELVGVFFSTFAQELAERYNVDFEAVDIKETVRSTIALGAAVEATDERLLCLVPLHTTVPPYSKHLSGGYPSDIDGESVISVPTDMMLT